MLDSIIEVLKTKNELDKNYEMVFECKNSTFIYKFSKEYLNSWMNS